MQLNVRQEKQSVRRGSLRARLAISISLILIAALGAVVQVTDTTFSTSMQQLAYREASSLRDLAAEQALGPMEFGDLEALNRLKIQMEKQPTILTLRFLDNSGRDLLAALESEQTPTLMRPATDQPEPTQTPSIHLSSTQQQRVTGEGSLLSTAPLMLGSVQVGTIELTSSLEQLELARATAGTRSVLVGLFGLLVAVLVTLYISRRLLRNLSTLVDAAHLLTKGDLTQPVQVSSLDEIGQLADAFENLRLSLQRSIGDMAQQANATTEVARAIEILVTASRAEMEAEVANVQTAIDSVGDMEQSMRLTNESAATMSRIAAESSTASNSLDEALKEISTRTDDLSDNTESTYDSIGQMRSSAEQINRSAMALSEQGQTSTKALAQIARSIREVQNNAQKSAGLADHFRTEAQQTGMDLVQKTVVGMGEIEMAVEQAAELVEKLGSRSEQIGTVLNVIKDISGKTRLLALNASIIATQAGEHGRSFAVVAREINALAERTQVSTEEIQVTVVGIQEDVDATTEATEHGRRRVREGVKLTSAALEALRSIATGAEESAGMAERISQATARQGNAVNAVSKTVERTSVMIQDIVNATQEQYKGVQMINRASADAQEATRRMRQRINEQASESVVVRKNGEVLADRAQQIAQLTTAQREGSATIRKAMDDIQRIAITNLNRFKALSTKVEILETNAKRLDEQSHHFRNESGSDNVTS